MKQFTRKFRHGLMIGVIAVSLPLAADSAPLCKCNSHASPMQPGAYVMPDAMVMPQPPGAMLPPLPIPPFISCLDLSELQQDKIFELLHSLEPTIREQHKALSKATEEMNRLAASDHYNQAEARTLADKLAKTLADTFVQHAATEAKMLALLTPEQRKQADEMRARAEANSVRPDDFPH